MPPFGPSYCGHGCTLVLWRVNSFGGPCLYSNWNPLKDWEDSRRTRVCTWNGCYRPMFYRFGPCWQDCFRRLWNLPNVGSSWQMESAKGKPLKISPKPSSGVAPWFLIWWDGKYCPSRTDGVTPAAPHGDGLRPLKLWAIVNLFH